ncbi:hypothetical protein GTP56_28120 [Duganella sp. FT134W]|uniref:Flagellar protein FliT n=1 Tax=Duganella margarita TaxID=2692170 RepID=A0A7X4H622_9BURK|nr:hypothetical protein [Duganella margarita]MYM76035.1 hypothetical protein [Duganella margarita]
MDRQRTLLQLTQKMSAAIAAEDWRALTAINTMLATTLPQMAAQGSWSSAERAALSALRQMHNEAVKRCDLATDALGSKLQQMQATQEGWLAYALESEHAETGIQA